MKEIIVKDILRECNGKLIYGNEYEICRNFSKDTRTTQKGDVYIGIKGENFDGNQFFEKALEAGAVICILQGEIELNNIQEQYPKSTIIMVEDTIKALQQIASYKRSLYNIPVIGITGSVGKTSTKDMIASVLSKKYSVCKTIGNLNNQIGVPLTILTLKEHTALVVEMGMSKLGEISTLTKIAKPTCCAITNVGTSHIGELGSRQNILKAKLEILEGLSKEGTVVINNDNDLLSEWKNTTGYNNITYGIENDSNIMAKDIELQEDKSKFTTIIEQKEYKVTVPVGGKHFILNALCAIAVGRICNMEMNDIIQGIACFELTKRRMDIQKSKSGIMVINDSYNASYDSMKGAIEYLSSIKEKRKIAILGDMLELGEYSKTLHEEVGKVVAQNKIDVLVTIGEQAKWIANHAYCKGEVIELDNIEEGIKKLPNILDKEDVVLIKASNGMHFDKIAEEILKL